MEVEVPEDINEDKEEDNDSLTESERSSCASQKNVVKTETKSDEISSQATSKGKSPKELRVLSQNVAKRSYRNVFDNKLHIQVEPDEILKGPSME